MTIEEVATISHEPLHYALAFFGWFLYNLLIFNVSKDKIDNDGKRFNYKSYIGKYWDNWLFTFCLAPVLVYYMQDLTVLFGKWLEKDIPELEIYYLGSGVLTEVIYYLLSKITKLRA